MKVSEVKYPTPIEKDMEKAIRDRLFSERLALSIGMFTRGEVGAGVIFIALGYSLGGPALLISVLTIVLNLILTGFFVVWVKKLALRSYHPGQA